MEKKKTKSTYKKNNGLFVVGGLSVINLLALLIPLIVLSIGLFSTLATTSSKFYNVIFAYAIPHLFAILLFMLASLLIAIGGFTRNNIIVLIGSVIYGVDFLISRVLDNVIDIIYAADYIRMSNSFVDIINKLFRSINIRVMFPRQACIPGALFINFGIILTLIIVIAKVFKAKGKAAKIIFTILAALAILVLFISALGDIIGINLTYSSVTIGTSYWGMVFLRIKSSLAMHRLDFTIFNYEEPFFFQIKDIHILLTFGILGLTSALTIPVQKKENQ